LLPPPDLDVLHALLDHIPGRVIVIGPDHRYLYVNREFLDFMGLTPDQALGRHVSELLGESIYESFLPVAEQLFRGESVRWEGWVDYPKQGRRYMQEHLLPYAPGGGAVRAVMAFGREFTELKQREVELAAQLQKLQESEALKSAIVDNALAAFISIDEASCIVEFNAAAEAMFQRQRDDVLGLPVSEIVMPQRFRAMHEAGMRRMQSGGDPRVLGKRMQLHALRADGSEFPIEMVLWRTAVGGTTFYTASMVDVTEAHAATREIERQREALRQSDKLTAMGSLLAGVAHELNNPLAIVMGRASLLEDKCQALVALSESEVPELPELQLDAQRIREAAERCGRIVRTFLNMARSRPARRSPVGLNEMVRAAAEMLHYGYRTHGIELDLALTDDLPTVLADSDQIGQVVMNLLVNAQQALASVQSRRCVRVQTGLEPRRANREQRVWLRVSDNGPGVPDQPGASRDQVFDPFFTTKPEGVGTGLGLAVSQSLARDHGGDLMLEPVSPQGGASFRLTLPMSGVAELDTKPALLPEPATVLQARVLVVDDEPELAELMREMLESAGHEVATAESGALALALLAEARFDAIVSDLRMPDMDGAGLWREVSARHPSLARSMLFVTGDTLSPDAREFLRRSSCASLDKPFSKADLLARVAAMLS